MAVIRVNKQTDYTVMSNYHFKEKGMTWKAKGVLSQMLSLPEDWDYSVEGLVGLSADGKDSVMSALKELEKFGYLKRTRVVDDKGKFVGFDYEIYESPQAEKPYAEKPNTENPQQSNTKIESTIINNKKKETLKERKNDEIDGVIDDDTIYRWFAKIWEIYPHKVDKVQARKTFEHKLRGMNYEEAKKKTWLIFRMLEQQVSVWEKNETEIQYIKHCSTWLNANIEDSKHFRRGKKR